MTQNKVTELKRCPFGKGEVVVENRTNDFVSDKTPRENLKCEMWLMRHDGLNIQLYGNSKEELTKIWNTRPIEEELQKKVTEYGIYASVHDDLVHLCNCLIENSFDEECSEELDRILEDMNERLTKHKENKDG